MPVEAPVQSRMQTEVEKLQRVGGLLNNFLNAEGPFKNHPYQKWDTAFKWQPFRIQELNNGNARVVLGPSFGFQRNRGFKMYGVIVSTETLAEHLEATGHPADELIDHIVPKPFNGGDTPSLKNLRESLKPQVASESSK